MRRGRALTPADPGPAAPIAGLAQDVGDTRAQAILAARCATGVRERQAQLPASAADGDAVGIGPGIGREDETLALVRAVSKRLERPLALDADGLIAFAGDLALLASRRAPTVLTPHPGEAAALLGTDASEVNASRPEAARELARRTGAIVLLKGAASIAAEPAGRIFVNPTGGPALGSGGTGDVLLGVVTGLLAQGLAPLHAAALAAYVHGAAADDWARLHGSSGLTASELARAIPAAMAGLRSTSDPPDAGTSLAASFPES